MNFRCKFRHPRSIRPPRFPVRVQNFDDLATFSVDFCILYAECPPYFYFPFVWPTDHSRVDPHVNNSHQVWSPYADPFLSYEWLWLDFWPFDLLTLNSCYAWRVTFLSDNVSHWLPSKMRTRPLRMRRITWPVSRGSKTITFLESPTPICLFTIQLLLGYDDY